MTGGTLFNPFAWLFLKLLYSDMELACDEAVISRLSDEKRKEYAHVLVSSVEKSNAFASANIFASTFGGANVRTRIDNILSYRKLSLFSIIGFISLLIAITYILLTNAV